MFGWEFPPHISGGLGTACFGLTQALAKANTHVLFVIPKADAETTGDHVDLISASNVRVPVELNEESIEQSAGKSIPHYETQQTSHIETLVVQSGIIPYTTPAIISFEESSRPALNIWNYQLPIVSTQEKPNKVWIQYQFSGSYGPSLLEEVAQYGTTGGEIARQHSFDVIHAHDWLTYGAGIAAKKVSGKPLIVHVHATEFDRAGKNIDERVYKIEQEGMEAADKVIAVSQWTKNIIVTKYHIPESKVEVVHNGAIQAKKRRNLKLPPIGKQIVTFLGRITFQKGPQYFVDAAAHVLKLFPDIHFVMAGSGDLLPEMVERAAKLKISSHLHFTGFLKGDQVDRVWAVTNVYVMPSVSEPFGISPLEAAHAGVPVIISNQSGVAEVMQHAIKIDFWNIEALADAICNLLKHQSLTRTLKHQSKEEISTITWDRAVKKINTIYHELTT